MDFITDFLDQKILLLIKNTIKYELLLIDMTTTQYIYSSEKVLIPKFFNYVNKLNNKVQ